MAANLSNDWPCQIARLAKDKPLGHSSRLLPMYLLKEKIDTSALKPKYKIGLAPNCVRLDRPEAQNQQDM